MFDRTTRLFLRFRDRGDTAALALVFDRTAPELLRLALHLQRHLGDAEDLLQATFLAAIESAQRFERSKRVMPWLTGILVNRARMGRRQQLHACDGTPEPDSLAGMHPDPCEAAADRELGTSAREALDRLDEPFRQPMLLRFVHGMEPTEIALLLRRSPGTVRGQLHRGLERLRGNLPTALAMTIAAGAVTTGHGLAAVRATVLREGARSAAATAASTTAVLTLTIAMTKKILLTSLVVACTVAIAVIAWPDASRPPVPDQAGANAHAQGVAATSMATAADDDAQATRVAAATQSPDRTVASIPEGATWPVSVVVIDGATNAPIADARVALHGPRSMTLLELQREFADVAPAGHTGIPQGGAELHALRNLPIEVQAGGEACDLLVPPADGAEPLLVATTDPSGRCELHAPASGTFLVVRHAGYGVGQLLLDEAPAADLKVTIWAAREFTGVVRTTDSEVPPISLRLALHSGQQVWFVETDEQGRFRTEVTTDSVDIRCVTPGWTTSRHYRKKSTGARWIGDRTFRVGNDADVYVAAYGATRLHVTDATTGQAIEAFSLIASNASGYPCRCGQFVAPGGWLALETPMETQLVLDQPEMASYRTMRAATLTVFTDAHAPFVLHDVPLLDEAPKIIAVALQPGSPNAFAGKVMRGKDAVSAARVQLRPLPPLSWDNGTSMVIATQTIDELGNFSLTAPPGDYVCEVFVAGRCELQNQVVLPTPGPVVLDLSASVFVDVLVVDPSGVPVPDHLTMVMAGVGQRTYGRTDSEGHIRLGPLAAGQLHALATRASSTGSWEGAAELKFAAEAGAQPSITLRLPLQEPIQTVLMFDGPGPAEGFAGFTATEHYAADTSVTVGRDGAVPIALLPGQGSLTIKAPDGRQWSFVLPVDARDGHVLQLRWQGLSYVGTAVDEDGAPIANARLDAYPTQPGPEVSVVTAKDGTFRLDGLEPCVYRLSIKDRPARSQHQLFPRQVWMPLAPPATEPPELRLQLHRADQEVLRGFEEFALVGRLVDAAGAPVSQALAGVSTLIPQAGGVLEVWPRPQLGRSDTFGTFRLQVVRGASYRSHLARGMGSQLQRQDVVLPSNQAEVHHEFVLR